VERDHCLLDLRCIADDQDEQMLQAVLAASRGLDGVAPPCT
jgi:hypothetical protein